MKTHAITPNFPYIERDESWMYFNHRLLEEAKRRDIPLLERFNFLGIYSSNLDEFFRVRVASLRRIADYQEPASDEMRIRARQTLQRIAQLHHDYAEDYEAALARAFGDLDKAHIHIVNERELTPEQSEEVHRYYMEHISSSINPVFICSNSTIPERTLKESIYLIVCLKPNIVSADESTPDLAVIEIPTKSFPRFIRLADDPDGESYIIFLDDVLRYCLPYIFAGLAYSDFEAYTFKLTKDSEIELESDLRHSMIDLVSLSLKRRRFGAPIRIVYDAAMPPAVLKRLCRLANIEQSDTLLGGGRYHDIKDLVHFPDCGKSGLRYPRWRTRTDIIEDYRESILKRIQQRDIGLHFPYKSFDTFLRLLREAAISPEVTEIRITLYRIAQHSKVIGALVAAAQNGKRVTAVIELLARFDEESNIAWSKKLQDRGVHVVFGHEKLKIHSKLVHIVTKQGAIACIGTGNLHEGNARLYTDYMLMTARPELTQEVLRVFDFIETPYLRTGFEHLCVAPNDMRRRLVEFIDYEISEARAGRMAWMKLKLNHIVDEAMVAKLYEASQAGVEIDLCVRGNCSVVPGLKGISDRIRINAIIDRYLEHARIYIFAHGGDVRYFIGSTDWMSRNLGKRIEVMTPILDPDIQRELSIIVDYGLQDTAQGYYVNTEGRLPRRYLVGDKATLFRSQEALQQYYQCE